MIARLALQDLRDSWVLWAAAAFVAAAGAFVALVPATLIESAFPITDVTSLALLAIAGTVIAFTVVSLVIVMGSVSRATIDARRPTFGLWQIGGVLPGQVGVVVFSQVVVVGIFGAIPGALLGLWFGPVFARATLTEALGAFDAHVGPTGVLSAVGAVTLLVGAAAIPAARRAADTPPVRLVSGIAATDRPSSPGVSGALVVKSVVAVALALLLYQLLASLPSSVSSGGSQPLLIGPALVALMCLPGRNAMAAVARLWTAIVPKVWSTSFMLARVDVTRSRDGAAPITPFAVAIGLPVTFLAGTSIASSASGATGNDPTEGTMLVLFGPVLLSAIGGGASLLLRSVQRRRETGVLDSLGAGTPVMLLQRLWEVVIGVATAALVGVIALVATVVAEFWVLAVTHPETAAYVEVRPLLAVTGLCLTIGLAVAASGAPGIVRRSRR
ncbi:FtsX-like permease family protein [Herbiconiux solani]|uniref:FtsX-like permease family protein n=1 Tax=Herbiconiux solani TaxID=661329 RepID=UPI0009FF84F9|nr:FtsX-like permease family protein [Herbiconiux solani]